MAGSNCNGSMGAYRLKVAWAAHRGAANDTGEAAEAYIEKLLPNDTFMMTDSSPDVILFMSGGSERRALELAGVERHDPNEAGASSGVSEPAGAERHDPDEVGGRSGASEPAGAEQTAPEPGGRIKPVLLLSIRGNNAFAAATEVMAWMINNGRMAILSDARDAAESGLLMRWQKAVCAWESLKGTKAGLIGTVSEWLVASDVPGKILKKQFGVTLVKIPWSGLPDYSGLEPDSSLLTRFHGQEAEGIEDAARVLTLLRSVISEHHLDAAGVECFSLVQQRMVTACLALAQLNTEGTVAACEGDLASMAGMIVGKALAGRVPWMANTTRLEDRMLILSHCTAPFDLVSEVKLPTHYETGYSLAVDGNIIPQEVTLFRLSENLDRAFVAEGSIISRPRLADACRTQVGIELPSRSIELLRNRPLGNHLLLIPGHHAGLLELAFRYKSVEILS